MFLVDAPGHQNNQFVEGDPNSGTPATEVPADWLNAVQAEFINVILAAGLQPNKELSNQLLQALQSGLTSRQIATNGYYVLPGGLIMQWGFVSAAAPVYLNFPITFPNAVFIGLATDADEYPSYSNMGILSTSEFVLRTDANSWFALGH